MSSVSRKATFAIITLIFSGLATLFVAEVGLRIWKRDVAFQPDPDLIRSLRPNVDTDIYGYETDDNLNGRSSEIPDRPVFMGTTKTNNLGLRMLEDIGPKAPDERRVLIYGDSYTEAIQIDAKKRFSDVADAALKESTEGRWRILNGGIMNGNLEQYMLMLRKLGKSLDPDLVVIILAPNDLEDGMAWEGRYGWVRDEAGRPLHPENQAWIEVTRLSYISRYLYTLLEYRFTAGMRFLFPSANPDMRRIPWYMLACEATDDAKSFFRSLTGKQLNMLREMSAELGADFAVLGIHYHYYFPDEPYYEKRFAGLPEQLEQHGCRESRGAAYEAFLWEYMEEQSIPFASIYDRFNDAKKKNPSRKLWHFYDYHFSAAGHELVAEELVKLVQDVAPTSSHTVSSTADGL